MTVIAGITTGDVRRVFAGGGDTIVAGAAGAKHLRVIDSVRRHPQGVVMAVLAEVGCTDMGQVFTGRLSAVMTRRTVAGDPGVIERRRQPGSRRVTVITGITTGDVGWVFAGGGDTIVTGAAGAKHLRVIDGVRRHPQRVVMAVLAEVGCTDVGQVFAGRLSAVMTRRAVAGDPGVIKGGR